MATSGQGVLRRLLAVFVFDADTKGLERGKKKTEDLLNDMKKVAAAFAGGVIAKGIGEFVKNTVDEMMQIRKGAAELRITTDEMQALRSAGRALGMDVKWLHFSMERLQVSTELAERGSKRQAESMKLLGLETRKANGEQKSAAELFLDTADGIAKLKDPTKQAIAVWDMFGRGAHRLLPLLRLGRERIQELMDATKEYGRYEKETIEQAAKYTITLEHLRLRFVGLKNFIMSQWLPILDKQTQGVIKAIGWFMKLAKNSLAAEAALRMLTVGMSALALKMAFAYPKATALIAGLTALWLIVDDLMVLFRGGHSLIGDAIDGLFGKGQSTALVKELRDLYANLAATLEGIAVTLGIKRPSLETDVALPPNGTSAAPTIGKTDVEVRRDWTRHFRTLNAPPVITQTPGGTQVQRGFLDRLLDPEGKNLHFGSTPILDTESRPGMDANMSVQVDNITVQMVPPDNTDPRTAGTMAGRAASEALQTEIRAAKAALRREKHASGE